MTLKLNRELAYKTILNERGHPHTTSVELLEEIINQYQLKLIFDTTNPKQQILDSPLKDEGWKTSYKYFEDKFGYKYGKTRYGFWRLEHYRLIERKAIIQPPKNTRIGGSILHILLNLKNIRELLI